MKYILYARKSTEEDDRQVLSIEAQLVELQEYAAKEKLEIVASFCEAKTAKEPVEKHRLEPYFVGAENKNFHKIVSQGRLSVALDVLSGYAKIERNLGMVPG